MTVQLQKMKMLIGGDWKDSSTGARSSVIDPSSGEIIAEAPRASKQDAKGAIDAAKSAFESPEWRDMDSGRGGEFSQSLRVWVGRIPTSLRGWRRRMRVRLSRSQRAMLHGQLRLSRILQDLPIRLRARRFLCRLSG